MNYPNSCHNLHIAGERHVQSLRGFGEVRPKRFSQLNEEHQDLLMHLHLLLHLSGLRES